MTQASPAGKPSGHSSTLGAAAAAAATGNGTAADKPADKPASGAPADKKSKSTRRVFVVVGPVHEFESAAKAEKFLNGPDAPTEYSVLRGQRIGTSKKVSLR